MAVTLEEGVFTGIGGGTGFPAAFSSTPADGDLIVMAVFFTSGAPAAWSTIGFTEIGTSSYYGGEFTMGYKVASGESSGTYTLAGTRDFNDNVIGLHYSGADTTTPIEASAFSTSGYGTYSAPSVTTLTDGAVHLAFVGNGFSTLSAADSGGYTALLEQRVAVSSATIATAGATGAVVMGYNQDVASASLAIKPAAVATSPWALEQSRALANSPAKASGSSLAFLSSVTAGNLLIATAQMRPADASGDAPVITVEDDVGSETWNLVDSQRSTSNHTGAMFWRIVQSGETTCATRFKATYSSSAEPVMTVAIYEFSTDDVGTIGLHAGAGNQNTGSTNNIATSSALSVVAGDLVLAFGSIRNISMTMAVDAPLTEIIGDQNFSNQLFYANDGVSYVTATGTRTPRFTGNKSASATIVAGQWRVTEGGPPVAPLTVHGGTLTVSGSGTLNIMTGAGLVAV